MIAFKSFAGQNWLITPAALAVNDPNPPRRISDQQWLVVLTGVGILDLQGNNVNDWHRETVWITPDIQGPLNYAINKYSIPRPGGGAVPVMSVEQLSPFAAISSIFDKDTNRVDAGYAVDRWRPHPFSNANDVNNQPIHNIFQGVDAEVAVRNNKAVLHRVSYHITLLGKIFFVPLIIFNELEREANTPVSELDTHSQNN